MEKRERTVIKSLKRGRPKGSKNKKAFQCDDVAKRYADMSIATHGIDAAEQLAVKILEKIRANKARLDEKYNQPSSQQAGHGNNSSGCALPIPKGE